MQKLTERATELLGMLTTKTDEIKEKVISLVKEAIPGAANMEFLGSFHDKHPSLSMASNLCACYKVVEPEEDICKGIFDSIESLVKSSDLKCSDAESDARELIDKFFENAHGLIDKFFKTYLPTATVKSLSLEEGCFCKPGIPTKWIAVNFDCASELNLNLIFAVSGYGERDMALWAKGSDGMIIEREMFKEPAKIGDALKNIETRVNGAPKKEPLTDHERIERLERIVKSIQDEIAKLKNR